MNFARRMSEIGTETAFEVLAKARKLEAQGRNVVHLEIGEPDFPTPPNIVEAAERALRDGFTHYTPAGGLTPAPPGGGERDRRGDGGGGKAGHGGMGGRSENVLPVSIPATGRTGEWGYLSEPSD